MSVKQARIDREARQGMVAGLARAIMRQGSEGWYRSRRSTWGNAAWTLDCEAAWLAG
jgi:hypothetical protein